MTSSKFTFPDATGPYSPTQANGGVTAEDMALSGSGASYNGTYLALPAGTYLTAGAAGIVTPITGDPATTQTPEELTLEYVGILPTGESPLVSLYDYDDGEFSLYNHWDTGRVRLRIERSGNTQLIESDGGLSTSSEERIAVKYVDDPAGAGGTVTFLRSGVAFGASQSTNFKPRVTPDAVLETNASLGNTSNSVPQQVSEVSLTLGATTPPPPPPPPPSGNGKVSKFIFPNATGPYSPAQLGGGVTAEEMALSGSGASYNGTYLALPAGTYLTAGAAGIVTPTTGDPATTQTPEELTLEYVGILPTGESPLVSLYDYADGEFSLYNHWDTGRVRLRIERSGNTQLIESDGGLSTSSEERIAVRYVDNPSGAGGTVTFLRNGATFGASQSTNFKPRVTPDAVLETNASLDNTANSVAQQVSEVSLTLGAATPPPPPPPPPGGISDVTVYGDPASRFPLDLVAENVNGTYDLVVPAGLSIEERTITLVPTDTASSYQTNSAGPDFAPSQSNGGVSSGTLSAVGSGRSYDGTFLNLAAGTYLSAGALGISLPQTSDPLTSQAPRAIELEFDGIIPAAESPLVSLYDYAKGEFSLYSDWQTGRIRAICERNGQRIVVSSPAGYSNTVRQRVAIRYEDDANGAGGTLSFLLDGAVVGSPQAIAFKPRITPDVLFECNASLGNTANSVAQKVASIKLEIEQLQTSESYSPVTTGTIGAATLENLVVNALSVASPQPAQQLSYTLQGGDMTLVDVVIGPIIVPAGAAYRAVLEDWRTGSAVDHPAVLEMVRPTRQNCRFEDDFLSQNQPPWMECLPQGAVPTINDIAYYCEAIRFGDYVQFQFGYDWTDTVMPDNPFGDCEGLDSYMVPHKWRIEDENGNLIDTIERADGGPLNGTDTPRIWNGGYAGDGTAATTPANRWHPHGTVRSGIVWRSRVPDGYSQAQINSELPRFDVSIPYASHTHFSTNGFDVRIFGSDSSNGFGNTRVIPFEPTDRETLVGQAGTTLDPYNTSLYSSSSLAAVAATWLKYTPFNQCGRSPITGPGGVRDDRAAIAEPVGQYMYDTASDRPHDGKPYATIALDFLTSYASDPYHCFEQGRCVPLFKGNNAGRDIGLRGHYYGLGNAARPASQSYYIKGGRPYEMASAYNPWSAIVPGKGSAADKPYFGTNEIDLPHAHQYPHWGTLLWSTPEFAMLGHKLSDQARLYENWILAAESGAPQLIGERGAAWQFLHAVLIWKTAARNSDRLYSRDEVLDFVATDFEIFSAAHKVSSPGFDNPPSNVLTNGSVDQDKSVYAAANVFGPVTVFDGDIVQHDFYIGYWLTALGIAERIGFNDALRARSSVAGDVVDWLISLHRKRIVGRINQAPRVNPGTDTQYLLKIWDNANIAANSGSVAALPGSFAALAAQNGNSATWDVFSWSGSTYTRDGQSTDQLIAGPSILKTLIGESGSDLDAAEITANSWRAQKRTEQDALPATNAGSTWFKYLQAVHNPALS
ncbi:MAG: hypothetical protein R3E18_07345 [Sphingomonadaceae bacterium]